MYIHAPTPWTYSSSSIPHSEGKGSLPFHSLNDQRFTDAQILPSVHTGQAVPKSTEIYILVLSVTTADVNGIKSPSVLLIGRND